MDDAAGSAGKARTDPVKAGDGRPFEIAEGTLDRLRHEGHPRSCPFFFWFLRPIPKDKLTLEGLPAERLLVARAAVGFALPVEER
jgi:hypothetical protein